jgi:hypothetical protein
MSRTTKAVKTETIEAGSIPLILDDSALSLAINENRIAGESIQENTHRLFLSAVYHADKFKNNTPLLELLSTFPAGMNLEAGKKWLKEFTAYDFKPAKSATALNKGTPAKVLKSSRKVAFTRASDRLKASLTPYYAIRNAAKKPAKFDLSGYLTNVGKKLEGMRDDEKLSDQDIATVCARLLAITQNLQTPVDHIASAPAAKLESETDTTSTTDTDIDSDMVAIASVG